MRGRNPRPFAVAAEDYLVLRWLAAGSGSPAYQVRRARILLAAAAGERIGELSERLGCHSATVWRVCRRYEEAGLSGVLADGRRDGRPRTRGREPC